MAAIVIAMAGCSTTAVPLKYAPPATVAAPTALGSPVVVGSFEDSRNEPDQRWIGAIRGGFGNSVRTLQADMPVADLVRNAFVDGLKARGVPSDGQRVGVQLSGRILTLECDQYVRREAKIKIELVVRDANGVTRFTRSYAASRVDGSLFSFGTGIFGSIDELRAVMEKTLRETVDRALDDSALRTALQA